MLKVSFTIPPSLLCNATSLYTREAIIQSLRHCFAMPPPFTQGRLLLYNSSDIASQCHLPLHKGGYNTIPPSLLRNATSLYTREAKIHSLRHCFAMPPPFTQGRLNKQSLRHCFAMPPPFTQGRLNIQSFRHCFAMLPRFTQGRLNIQSLRHCFAMPPPFTQGRLNIQSLRHCFAMPPPSTQGRLYCKKIHRVLFRWIFLSCFYFFGALIDSVLKVKTTFDLSVGVFAVKMS